MIRKITQNTLVSIPIVMMIVSIVIWATSLAGKVTVMENKMTVLEEMNIRLARIEGALGIKPKGK